jgi:5'-nucleotidase (lipoprotein e(P4) family)
MPVGTQNSLPISNPSDYNLNGTLWQQSSAEYKAICYQTFALAKLKLAEKIKQLKKGNRKLAIVTDIDETILDNSPQQATDIINHVTFTEAEWLRWTNSAQAKPLPGAVDFFQWAYKMGVQCFYVTNRNQQELVPTIKNLSDAGFPQADTIHVMMRQTTSDKEPRRKKIKSIYTIVMLLGDNLNDFDEMFYKQPWPTRCNLVNENSTLFGDSFIILPNPVYGDWENALWNNEKITPAEIEKSKRAALKGY